MKLPSLLLGLVVCLAATFALPLQAADPATFEVAGITFARPSEWSWVEVTSPMRKAQLRVGGPDTAVGGDITFFHFVGAGADVDANSKRWLAQFKSKADAEKVEAKVLNGVKVTLVTTEGTFASGMPGGPTTAMEDYALIGAIIEATEGSVFVKFTGPSKIVKGEKEKFLQFVTDATKTKK